MLQVVHGVRTQAPGLDVRVAWVELVRPDIRTALSALPAGRDVVVVPLLLSSGYHDRVDIPAALDAVRPETVQARVLGPDPLLATALADRLAEAGWQPGDAVVLAAAGSSDQQAVTSVREQAAILQAELGRRTGAAQASGPGGPAGPGDRFALVPVTVGFASAAEPGVAAAVARARAGARRVVVAPYLLAPGFFLTILHGAGADLVAAPIGAHPAVVDLVLRRYQAAAGHPPEFRPSSLAPVTDQ